MTKERRLGKGLEALLGRPLPDGSELLADMNLHGQFNDAPPSDATIDVNFIDPNPFQPRVDFDEASLKDLSESIKEHGLIQPLAVRRSGIRYQLIAGERRLRAAKLAGWKLVPVQIHLVNDQELAELAIVENLQRKDLNAMEKAASFQDYLDRFNLTQEQLSLRLKIDRSTVSNLIRLLELPDEVQRAVRGGKIGLGHARALLPLGDENEQLTVCRRIQREGLSVRAVEELINEQIQAEEGTELAVVTPETNTPVTPSRVRRSRNDQVRSLEQDLRSALGTKCELKHGPRGNGKIVIHYANHAEFERIFEMLAEPMKKIA